MTRRALAIFTFSGAAGLVFEVALQRSVARAFGVSAFATSTVLASYMAGLALGALLFGRLADRVKRPARLYAGLEAGVGLCALATPWATQATVAVFSRLAHGSAPDDPKLVVARLVVAFGLTLLPTMLMGGTLPAMGRALEGQALARLYTANMLGAALGAGLGAYALLPTLGLARLLWLGAALNFIAAGLAWSMAPTQPSPPLPAPRAAGAGVKGWVFLVAGWSGLATFIAEVVWFHLLSVVVGSSAYAFGLMLAVFLAGLTWGSHWVAKQPETRITFVTLGRVQLAIAAALTVSLVLWERVPTLFIIAGAVSPPFWVREFVRVIACVELVLVPAALLGAVYPLALRITEREAQPGWAVGRVAASNTLGAVLGALATGFVLLPMLGGRGVLLLLVVGAAVVAMLALPGRARLWPVAVMVGAMALPAWKLGKLGSGANVYFTQTPFAADDDVLLAKESVSSGLTTVVRAADGTTSLLTNGKFQGNDTGEVAAQRGFSQVPLLAQRHFGRALLIGVGTGCSLATLAAQPFEHIDAADVSTDILAAARTYFGHVNDHVLEPNPRITVSVADGRNLLLLSAQRYDLVALELTSIWFSGAGDLYNRDFYELVKRKLEPEGVVQQWVQLHHLTRRDLAVILNSAAQVFAHVHLYFIGGQGVVLASDAPLEADLARLNALSERLRGTAAVEGLPNGDLTLLTGRLALDDEGVRRLVEEEASRANLRVTDFVSTDDNLWLEYSTPKGNARAELTADALLASINTLLADRHPRTTAATREDVVHLNAAWWLARGDAQEAQRVLEAGPRDAFTDALLAQLTAASAGPRQ